ncbi:hypothetical protein EJB05_51871, partial [Eragrostis curvula]
MAMSQRSQAGNAITDTSSALLPRANFLSDAVLSWTISNVLDANFYKEKVRKIPDVFETAEAFADIYCQGQIVWAPPGTMKGCFAELMKDLLKSKRKEDSAKVRELLKTMKELKSLLLNENLKDDYLAAAFQLLPGVGASASDSIDSLAEELNKMRTTSIKLMSDLINSVQVPNPQNRDELDKLCIKHNSIIVTTVDCTLKLHDMEAYPFDVVLMLGTNQIKEADLLVPFLHSMKHIILFGDPHHLQPVVQSEICKEAGYSVSIFDKMQQSVPKKVVMLKQQFAIDPLISKFPNNYYYDGVIADGPNVMSLDYNKEFSKKLPVYGFMDISLEKMRPGNKSYVNAASIFLLLQLFCKATKNSNRMLSIVVVCISSDEADTIQDWLRSKNEIYAKVHLHVKSLDNLQDESFDMVILSMLVEDETELTRIKENNLYAAITSSRHYFWMVGESSALIRTGGICVSLLTDATERGLFKSMNIDKLSEAVKQFENIDKDQRTNFVLSNRFTHLYGKMVTKKFQSEDIADRGIQRLENAFAAFESLGVMARNESGSEYREFKISGHELVDHSNSEAMTELLDTGNIMVGRFRLSRNYYSLKPGEVYVYDADQQIYHPKSGLAASHGAMMIGSGRTQTKLKENGKPVYARHMVMQNSEGDLFGINGIGRVGKKTVTELYRIHVPEANLCI